MIIDFAPKKMLILSPTELLYAFKDANATKIESIKFSRDTKET